MSHATDQPQDVGLYGRRAPPVRLAPSMLAVVNSPPGSPIPVPEGTALLVLFTGLPQASAGITLFRGGASASVTVTIGAMSEVYLRAADGWTGAQWSASGIVAFLVVDVGTYPSTIVPGRLPTATTVAGTITAQLLLAQISGIDLAPTSIGAGTAETVKATSTSVPSGTLVRVNASVLSPLATAADDGTYLAVKGSTSGLYYLVVGANQAVPATFRMVQTEDLTIVVKNADTVAHTMTAHVDSWSGELS